MKTLVLLLAAATLALAQQKGAPPPEPLAPGEVIRVIEVKQGRADVIVASLSSIFPGISRVNNQLIVRGTTSVVDIVEAAVKRLDVPAPDAQAPNVELTVQLLLASTQEAPDAKVPAEMESTVKQLRALFPYKSYRVLETQIFQGRSGATNILRASGALPGTGSSFDFTVSPRVNLGPAPRTVRLSQLSLSLTLNKDVPGKASSVRISTDMDARENQKTVVGKANLMESTEAIFLVITPKVVE